MGTSSQRAPGRLSQTAGIEILGNGEPKSDVSRSKVRLGLYRTLDRLLPVGIRQILLRGRVIRGARKWLFGGPNGQELAGGLVHWEDWRFQFAAHYSGFLKARSIGIENRICRLARSILEPGDVAIDVGANYGFITTVMAKSVQPGGVVVAFESDPGICRVLEQTLVANDLDGAVRLIGARAGAMHGDGWATIDSTSQECGLESLAFLKIDVDGGDLDVLRGAQASLRSHQPVVVVEMSRNEQEIYDLLRQTGYTHFYDQSNRPVSPGQWPPNLIAATRAVRIPDRGSFQSR